MAEQDSDNSIVPVRIESEMRSSYIDYAMSVIVGRALPDVRDGLKPVHRRILYAMYEQGNTYNRAYKKSARIVGNVIGKYHPHGDSAVYDALVRMAQDFSMRLPLVDGQGNFGSIDGDKAAAMRYTEVRMTRACGAMLADIDKETVDYGPNYDNSEMEPLVLPTRIPNLLVNGSEGIAVGMATRIPPHNLHEVVSAVIALIDNPELTFDELLGIVKGPDFPTAASIHGISGIREAYRTGRGSIRIRARTEIEHNERSGKSAIIVTELPFQVNKARLLEKIAQLIREKAIEGITDLRDESDRSGMRIFIELRRDVMPQVILNQLFKKTELQKSFGMNMLAIVAGQPKTLTLREILEHFIDFRRDVVTRRCLYELRKAEERLHILYGLRKALDMIDEVVATIRASADVEEARAGLIELLEIDLIQANAILDMRLQRLTNLEIDKLIEEIEQIEARVARLREILDNESELLGVIRGELEDVRQTYGTERATEILPDEGDFSIEDLIEDKDEVLTLTHSGYIKRTDMAEVRVQKRGGKGLKGMETKDEDVIVDVWATNTHASLLVFTSVGKAYVLKVHEVPAGGRNSRGKPIVNLIPVEKDERVQAIVPFESFDDDVFIITATRAGIVKKSQLSRFKNIHSSGIIGVKLNDGDELINARLCREGDDVMLVTRFGRSIRFDQDDARPMGRNTTGVKGITLRADDEVVSMVVMSREHIDASAAISSLSGEDTLDDELDDDDATVDEAVEEEAVDDVALDEIDAENIGGFGRYVAGCRTVLTITERGFGKRTHFEEYRRQTRGGKGIITMKLRSEDALVRCRLVDDSDQVILITDTGRIIRTRTSDISILGRNTQGVRLMRLADNERIVGVARYAEREVEEDDADAELEDPSAEAGSDEHAGDAQSDAAPDDAGDVQSDDPGNDED